MDPFITEMNRGKNHLTHFQMQVQNSTSSLCYSQLPLRRSTGNDVRGHYFYYYFLSFSSFSVIYFSHRSSAQIKISI